MPQAYENAGVSVEAGYEVVKRIKSHVARTNRPGVVGGIGGFGGLFDLASLGYKEPVLISGTDGVGTKLVVAKMVDKHDTIGVDCVAMCVNDIAAQGAEPLFFLDYIACGKNDPALLEQVVSGVADGCVQSEAGLIGGETAEMPGMYDEDEYDLAGFAVGVAEKSAIVDGSGITAGDVLIGLPSTGVHSNGFSLVRKALFEQAGYTVDTVLPELGGAKLGDVLLTPTKIYVKTLKPLFKAGIVKGVAPITGGMGAYSPVPQIGQDVIDTAIDTIVRPTVEAMAAEGTPFTGILYAGLIATADGPKVIEFNARFGDPETEVVLPKLTSDLGAAISAILDGGTPAFTWDSDNATLGVVLASNGYPVNVIKGAKIPSIPVDDASHVYYAGVSNSDQGLVASSGRVLLVETTAPDLKSAQDKVYAIIDKLDTEGMFYRHDIGAKALK